MFSPIYNSAVFFHGGLLQKRDAGGLCLSSRCPSIRFPSRHRCFLRRSPQVSIVNSVPDVLFKTRQIGSWSWIRDVWCTLARVTCYSVHSSLEFPASAALPQENLHPRVVLFSCPILRFLYDYYHLVRLLTLISSSFSVGYDILQLSWVMLRWICPLSAHIFKRVSVAQLTKNFSSHAH